MATPDDMQWGSYMQYEGPYYPGACKFELPDDPTHADKIMAVITATEGGKWDALNMYDRCICTSGLIQWCEAGMYGVSDMLGAVAEKNWDLIYSCLSPISLGGKIDFRMNDKGRWRFFIDDEEVDTLQEQRKLFLLHSDGTKGSWDEKSKKHAKEFGAAICTVWEAHDAQQYQKEFTVKRLWWFGMALFKKLMEGAPKGSPITDAFEAGYLSFAANNPKRADEALHAALELGGIATPCVPWTEKWLNAIMYELTFNSGVSIYPHRYKTIQPVLEDLYGVTLNDLYLEDWKSTRGVNIISPVELQRALEALGYDLGPSGADGVIGPKTRQAVLTFEKQHELSLVDGLPDVETVTALEKELERRGKEILLDGE